MSLVASNKLDTNRYEVEVSVDGEAFQKAINRVYKKEVKKINIPGFRKGKASRSVIEKMYGKEVFYEDAMQDLYPQYLQEAVEEAGLKVINDKIDLDVTEVSANGFTFKAAVTTYPEVAIDGYKGIEIEAESEEVTDEKIDAEIEKARQRASSVAAVEDRPAQDGDTVVIDFEGFKDGEPFEGGKGENYNLTLGSGSFIPGFEEKVAGHNKDEEFTIDLSFPEDYQVEELAGQPVEFKIKIHEIKTRILPELDDDFVMDVSEDSSTVEEYRKEIAENLEEDFKKARETDIENKLSEALIEKLEGEIPQAMYENKITDMVREFEMRLRSQGLELETYMQYMGLTEESLRGQYEETAEKRVKLRLALEKIAEIENIEASEDDLSEEYKKIADVYNMDSEAVKLAIPAEDLKKDVAVSKAMDLVKETAVVK